MKTFVFIKKIDRTLGAGFIFLLSKASKLFSKKKKVKIEKILVIKFGNLGDVFFTIPALGALDKKFSKKEIVLLTSNKTCGIYSRYPYFDRIINFNFEENKGFAKDIFFTFRNILNLIRIIRKENFDTIIDMENYSTFTCFLSFISDAKTRLGLDVKGTNRGLLYTHSMPCLKENRHEKDTFIELVSLIGVEAVEDNINFKRTKEEENYVDLFLKNHSISQNDLLIGVHAGSNPEWLIKRWPKECFKELIKDIVKKYGAKVILVGAKDEEGLIKDISSSGKNIINSAGKFNIGQLAALISRCDLFICNDSAPMHIAESVRTPIVAIMGPTNPLRWGPYGKEDIIVNRKIQCSYCRETGSVESNCTNIECMKKIRVEDVMGAVETQIERIKKSFFSYEQIPNILKGEELGCTIK